MSEQTSGGGSAGGGKTWRLQEVAAKLGLSRPQAVRLAAATVGLWGLAALLALLLPVSAPLPDSTIVRPPEPQAETGPPSEDLQDFMRSTRWGVSFEEAQRQAAIRAGADKQRGALNPELREMGFVGLFVVPGRTSILMVLEDGTVRRLDIGDEVPDGRRLAAVGGNRLTLADASGQQYELLLFPEVG